MTEELTEQLKLLKIASSKDENAATPLTNKDSLQAHESFHTPKSDKFSGRKKDRFINVCKRIDLTSTTFDEAKERLVILVDKILEYNKESMIHFYIGKTNVNVCTDPKDVKTWNTDRIIAQYCNATLDLKKMKPAGAGKHFAKQQEMFILAVVDKHCLPVGAIETHCQNESISEAKLTETYTTTLESALISHYLFKNMKKELANRGTHDGGSAVKTKKKEGKDKQEKESSQTDKLATNESTHDDESAVKTKKKKGEDKQEKESSQTDKLATNESTHDDESAVKTKKKKGEDKQEKESSQADKIANESTQEDESETKDESKTEGETTNHVFVIYLRVAKSEENVNKTLEYT